MEERKKICTEKNKYKWKRNNNVEEICFAGCADLTKQIFEKNAYRGFLQEGAEFTCPGVSRQAEQRADFNGTRFVGSC